MIEKSSGKNEGQTKGQKFNPLILLEEFFTGLTVDQNLTNLVKHFATNSGEVPVLGEDFW